MRHCATHHGKAPRVFVSASAVGYYGNRHDAPTPESAPAGDNFLAEICLRWEQEALHAASILVSGASDFPAPAPADTNANAIRVAMPRIGIVLHPSGGALQKMMLPFALFAGMPLGSGKQWFPWIHIADLVRGICEPLTNTRLQGAYNLAAPQPVTMAGFCDALGTAMRRPSWQWLAVPEFALHLALGEAATSLTDGQRIVPEALLNAGFSFEYNDVSVALADLL
jgi:uncharacterized protein